VPSCDRFAGRRERSTDLVILTAFPGSVDYKAATKKSLASIPLNLEITRAGSAAVEPRICGSINRASPGRHAQVHGIGFDLLQIDQQAEWSGRLTRNDGRTIAGTVEISQ
jgi:hypothetical protein